MLISDRVFPLWEYSVGANIVRPVGWPSYAAVPLHTAEWVSFFVSDVISFTLLIFDQVFPLWEYSVGANIVRPPAFPAASLPLEGKVASLR